MLTSLKTANFNLILIICYWTSQETFSSVQQWTQSSLDYSSKRKTNELLKYESLFSLPLKRKEILYTITNTNSFQILSLLELCSNEYHKDTRLNLFLMSLKPCWFIKLKCLKWDKYDLFNINSSICVIS